jgi:hypothetical protein
MLVDSRVWIDHFRGNTTPQTDFLRDALSTLGQNVLIGNLILAEVLRGFSEIDARRTKSAFDKLECVELAGCELAIKAARNYRALRAKGVTVRSTIDCLIATYCIEARIPLLHGDRDFDPFTEHLGLKAVLV